MSLDAAPPPSGGKAAARARAAAQEAALSVSLQKFKRDGQASACGGWPTAFTDAPAAAGCDRGRERQEAQGPAQRVREACARCRAQRREGAPLDGQTTCGGCRAALTLCRAAQTEQWLLPAEAGFIEAEGMERTYRFSQEALASSADATSSRKAFDLSLPELGPYCLDYTPNGRHMLLGGRKGHLAVVDWAKPRLTTELQVRRCFVSPAAAAVCRAQRLCFYRCERKCGL